MNALTLAILTGHTCGPSCWEARESVCRCECGGRNHGILCVPGGVRPSRRSKIDGESYTLRAVALHRHYQFTQAVFEAHPRQKIMKAGYYPGDPPREKVFYWRETDPHSPARVKMASKEQLAKWPELTAFKNINRWECCYLLWLKDGFTLSPELESLLEEPAKETA